MLGKHSFPHGVRTWMLLIAGGVTLNMIFLYQPVRIEGNSMAPLLCDHEAIFINRIIYHLEPVQRGDVVVFAYPLDGTHSFRRKERRTRGLQ